MVDTLPDSHMQAPLDTHTNTDIIHLGNSFVISIICLSKKKTCFIIPPVECAIQPAVYEYIWETITS